ncbi:hypothetical protein SAMN04487905_102425 [Actinopolyspora xinjiangensis]|uniref:Uncharacterized protein n=1 Tax=Actinopolyspora xinjiangensis TaxID=405564 RepID=A0A1H0QWJ3_9ACTN|nr:hypothetical protein [Actinopolyspora xinjiangensis]SDP21590.1 hypothetical protein SAMN04487905_102425 [Actinopolyspora xinjiangensis]
MTESGQTFNFEGNSFHGPQNFAPGGSAYTTQGDGQRGELDRLRELVAELVESLSRYSDGDVNSARAYDQASEMAELLEETSPDGESVRRKWSRLRPLLETLGTVGSVASIAGLLGNLF